MGPGEEYAQSLHDERMREHEEKDALKRERDEAIAILKRALKQVACDGDLCAYAWHEDARALIRQSEPDWVI